MKFIVNISLVLVLFLSTAVFAAKSKKPAAEPKKSAVEPKKPVTEPNKPVVEPNAPPQGVLRTAGEPNLVKDANQFGAITVTVNGTPITEAGVEEVLDLHMQQIAGKVPENGIPQYRQRVRKYIIDQLVVQELVAQDEKRNNITVSEAELTERINKQVAEQNLTLDEWKALLKAYGRSFSDYQQDTRKSLMDEKLREILFAGKLQMPADEQAKAFYDENIQKFSEPEKIHAKHILIRPEDSNDPNQGKAQAKAKAQELLEKIKAGANFEELAKQYSACPSAKDGGDLGMQPKGTFVPEFEKATFALKPGQVSDIVQTNFGYHIIKLIEHIDANTISFSQAKDQILQVLVNEQKKQIVTDYVQKIKAEADIKYTNEADKLEPQITGTKPTPPRRQNENAQSSDVNNPKKD